MDTIRVKTVDFDPARTEEQDNFIVDLLRKKYHVIYSDEPDYLIYSVWGEEHLKYQCTKLFYTGEPVTPNFNECDYAIGFDPIDFGERYMRLPLFAIQIKPSIQNRNEFMDIDMEKRKFCNFVYSNEFKGDGAFIRKDFCRMMMNYKQVDCPGMVLNNMSSDIIPSRWSDDWYQGKIRFLRDYKFTIAFENSLMDGYTTEKLTQPFQAGSIPIYYGNPRVAEEFNRNAFIDCNKFDNDFDAVIEEVKRVDRDAELAKYMVMQNPMQKGFDFAWEERLLKFLTGMIENGRRRYIQQTGKKGGGVDIRRSGTLNYQMYQKGIIEGLREWKEIAIYGNGNFALNVRNFLNTWEIDTVSVCLVTKKRDAGGDFLGLPITAIEEWKPITDNPLILVAVRESSQEKLICELVERGYRNFLSINDFLVEVMETDGNTRTSKE